MNNDLISRSSFKDLLRTLSERETGTPRVIIDWIAGCVDQFPAVDAVEVVRCKDCKHYDEYFRKCYVFCTGEYNTELEVEDDDFCSYGERREDG